MEIYEQNFFSSALHRRAVSAGIVGRGRQSEREREREKEIEIWLPSPSALLHVNFSISCTNKAFFGIINHAQAQAQLSTKCLSITDPSVVVAQQESRVAAQSVPNRLAEHTHCPTRAHRYIKL